LLLVANEQLRKKERLLREAKKKLETLEGRNLENKSKNELILLQKQLADVSKLINFTLEKTKH
jgi:hypothetical protein